MIIWHFKRNIKSIQYRFARHNKWPDASICCRPKLKKWFVNYAAEVFYSKWLPRHVPNNVKAQNKHTHIHIWCYHRSPHTIISNMCAPTLWLDLLLFKFLAHICCCHIFGHEWIYLPFRTLLLPSIFFRHSVSCFLCSFRGKWVNERSSRCFYLRHIFRAFVLLAFSAHTPSHFEILVWR